MDIENERFTVQREKRVSPHTYKQKMQLDVVDSPCRNMFWLARGMKRLVLLYFSVIFGGLKVPESFDTIKSKPRICEQTCV